MHEILSRIRGKIFYEFSMKNSTKKKFLSFHQKFKFPGNVPITIIIQSRRLFLRFFEAPLSNFPSNFLVFSSILVSNSCNVIRNCEPDSSILDSIANAIVVNKFLRNNQNVQFNFSGIQQRVFQRQLRSLGRFEWPGSGRVSARCEGHLLGVSLILLKFNINKLFCGKYWKKYCY